MTVPTHFEDQLLRQLRTTVAENAATSVPTPVRRSPALRARLALSGAGLALAAVAAVILLAGSGTVPQSAFAVDAHSNGTVTVHVHSLSDAAGLQQSLREAGVPALVNYEPATSLPACPTPKGQIVDTKSVITGKDHPQSTFNSKGSPDTRPTPTISGSESGSSERSLSTGGPADPGLSSGGPANPKGLPAPPAGASVISGSVSVSPDGVTFSVTPGAIKADEQLVITTSEGTLSSIGMAVVKRSVGACSATPPPPPAP